MIEYQFETHLSAEFPKVLKEHGSARIINGFETNGPLPFQLQLVMKIPPAFNHQGVLSTLYNLALISAICIQGIVESFNGIQKVLY